MTIKPQAKVARSTTPQKAFVWPLGDPEIVLAAWCPDDKAELPPEQVHLSFIVPGLKYPLTMRFKSPDTLSFLIEELAEYRREVWPDCEPVNANDHQAR